MWRKTFQFSSCRSLQALSRRSYLSESYKLTQDWSQRLQTPILQKVSVENLYYDIDSKFNQQKKISPVDVDIYANKVIDRHHMDEIADLISKLRSTPEATNMFDSTQHALIRYYIDHGHVESLVQVLDHRRQFGVFLDDLTANLLLDKLIQEKNFKLGARVATLIGLQEDFSNPITLYMSAYACHQFLGQLEPFEDLVEKPVEEVPEPGKAAPTKKKKKEEVRVRVAFLTNPFFDDHFDLKNTNHLLGKTFLYLADEVRASNETLANSFNLLGFALYEKFEDGNKFLSKSSAAGFFKESVEVAKSLAEKVENIEANEPAKQFFDSIGSLKSVKDGNIADIIEASIKTAIDQQAPKDVEEQKKIYAKWNVEREQKLNDEIHRYERIQRLYNVEKVQKDLEAEEKKLWFFENEDKIDLEIEDKKVFYPKRWFGKLKKPRKVDENYIPPDVDRRRNLKEKK